MAMRQKEILKLVLGFRRFRQRYFDPENSIYQKLTSSGQSPKTLIIGCSDSRVDPAIISSASPGEIFVVRNVANLVPPYEASAGLHGVSAAIEFAIVNLKVENVLILGHRQCGGIRVLMTNQQLPQGSFIGPWMSIAQKAKEKVLEKYSGQDEDSLCRHCELESIVTSLDNLRSFPFVQDAIENRGLNIFGVYFDLELGQLLEFDPAQNSFTPIDA